MKNILILAAATIISATSVAQNGAHIEYKLSSTKGATGSIKVNYSEFGSISDFSMAVPQMPGGGIEMKNLIMKENPDVMYSINDKDKTYSERKTSDAPNEDNKTYVVTKLGEEKINGYKCIHASVTTDNETHEVWNTKDIGDYEKYSTSLRPNKKMGSQKMEQALKDAGCAGFPVKSIHKGNEKEGDMTMELVKFEKKTFSKSDFEIPAGYTKSASTGPGGMKSTEEIRKMTPEERLKYIEEMKKKNGK